MEPILNFDLWQFTLDNLEAAGAIGGYVSIAIIGVALITFFSRGRLKSARSLGPKWAQPILGALLGIIPGCGGTIIASSMYKNKKLTLGGLLATFTSTLGEGSFVLLGASDEADTIANLTGFAIVSVVGFIVGVIVGFIVDGFGITFARQESIEEVRANGKEFKNPKPVSKYFLEGMGFYAILAMGAFLLPGSIMALWGGGIDLLADMTVWVCIALTLLCIVYYLLNRFFHHDACCHDHDDMKSHLVHAVADIALVVFFVLIGLFISNYIIDVVVGAERFDEWMTSSRLAVVIIAALIGATPGCGGMIAVAVAYTSIDHFPIAALIAASLATSGDGIFPLLAKNKKDAIVITVVGLAIALVVGFLALLF